MPGMKTLLSIDLETFSAADIKSVGSYRYIDDPSFEIMLLAYAFDDEPVEVVDLTSGSPIPDPVLHALTDPAVTKTAWNCAFEREALRKHLGVSLPAEQWEDSMVLAAVCGLPMSLGAAGAALGLPEDQAKDRAGKALIRYFCSPCKPTKANGGRERNLPEHAPEKWATFIEYNRQDVVAERTIREMLERWKPDETEHRFWCLDAKINERGIRVDLPLVRHAIDFDARYKAMLTEEATTLTGIENPNSVAQIKDWLLQQEGLAVPSLNKKVVADVVAQLSTDKAKQFMALRTKLAKSSTKKYEAMERTACSDDHTKGCFMFYGASRTGRFAGRHVQLQNLPQNHMSDLDSARQLVEQGDYDSALALYGDISPMLSELIRTALIPEPGCQFLVADFSAIEARVIAYLCGEEWRLDVFRNGGDIYCASASQMFHVPVVKHGENGHLRQKGKIAELALGYGGGVNALKAFGADKLGMTDEEMVQTVDLWREASPHICALWRSLEKAAIRCVVHRVTTIDKVAHIRFDMENGVLWMTLPSGRRIAYFGAAYEESKFGHGKSLTYMGVDQKTKKWGRLETWGGKLAENCWGENTPVLTACGWVCIKDVQPGDLVFDGVDWVTCGGSIYKGVRPTIGLNGQRVTPEHLILTKEGWKHAETTNGLDRATIRNPDRNRSYYAPVSTESWSGGRLSVDAARRDEPVYDLINCGPRHSFVVACDGGPLIVHNCTQATARDCLREAMLALDAAGFDIRAHVHDEVIISEPIGGRSVEEVAEIMGAPIQWAPGLPLRADGYACPYYMKD